VDPAVGSVAFAPSNFVVDSAGVWARGNGFVRYRADGSVAYTDASSSSTNSYLVETIDGGVAYASAISFDPSTFGSCGVSKRAASGTLQWFYDQIVVGESCDSLASDGGGTLWLTTRAGIAADSVSVYRIGSDGSGLIGPLALPANFVALSLAGAKADGSYVAGYDSAASHPSVVALDTNGGVRWQFTDTTGSGEFTQIGIDGVGNVRVAGEAADHTLVVAGVDPAGHAIGVTRADAPGADRTSGLAVAADGASFNDVPSADGSHRMLQKIDPSETLIAQADVPVQGRGSDSSLVDGHAAVRIAPNGDVLVLGDTGNGDATSTKVTLVRFDPAGNVVNSADIDATAGSAAIYTGSMAALADSSTLLSVYTNGAPADYDRFGSTNQRLVHVDLSGHLAGGPLAPVAIPATVESAASMIGADGTAFLLANNIGALVDPLVSGNNVSKTSLSAVSPQGSLDWKVSADGYWYFPGLALGPDRICIYGPRSETAYFLDDPDPNASSMIECHSLEDGSVLATGYPQPVDGVSELLESLSFGAAGRLIAVYASLDQFGQPQSIDVATLDAALEITGTQHVDTPASIFAACSDGSVGLVANGSPVEITRVAPDGSVAWTHPIAVDGAEYFAAKCLDDGSFALEGQNSAAAAVPLVTSVSADGTARWTTAVLDAASNLPFSAGNLASDGSSIYVSMLVGQPGQGGGGALGDPIDNPTVIRLSRSSGALEWTQTFGPSFQIGVTVAPDGEPVVYTGVKLYVLDPATGETNLVKHATCSAGGCGVDMLVTADDTFHYTAWSFNPEGLHDAAVDAVTSPPATIDPLQAGVGGIWYAPYEGGHGFGIDQVAGSNTFFVSWFTYAPVDADTNVTNDPAALRWYTLQGSADSTENVVPLIIYANTGGTFATGVTTPEDVGMANLSFSDCSHAKLTYAFSQSGGASSAGMSGSIDLIRLTPQPADCILPTGTTPGADVADNDGFETRQSGAWFDPSSSGQGVEFSITPSSAASSGLVFGAWFTYDPAGGLDDPTSQHWFTLQGDLSAGNRGSVVVPIYSTLGGSFDDVPATTTMRIGQATLTFDDCSSATLTYQFDDNVLAGSYRNLDGTLHLAPLTACSSR
jgi:hypothetical protein